MRYFRFILLAVTIAALPVLMSRSVFDRTPPQDGATASWAPVTEQQLSHGRFQNFPVYIPHGAPRGFVLLLSGREGWNASLVDLARRLSLQGAMVAGIDAGRFAASLDTDGGNCVFPDGDMENLSHFVQAYYRLPAYLTPILAGASSGASLAYAMLIQAPANTFGGAVSLDFCPSLDMHKGLCKTSGLDYRTRDPGGFEFLPAKRLPAPWTVVQPTAPTGAGVSSCDARAAADFVAAIPGARLITLPVGAAASIGDSDTEIRSAVQTIASLMEKNAPAALDVAPRALGDLPLVMVPAQSAAPRSNTFAILLSGDGGWAGLDKDVASALSADGMTVIGLDSLRYFWTPRSPEGLATDLDRIIRYYLTALGKQRVVLIGYSQGADVLPFAVNRLPPDIRAQVALTAIMGMSEHALFEFHMTSWVADDDSGPATLPEVARITDIPVLCVYGEDENDSLCPHLDPHKVTLVKLKGGHHFDGNYAGLAATILSAEHH